MTRAELARDLTAVARSLVLAAAVIENLAFTLQSPQNGLDLEECPAPGRGASLPPCTCPPCLAERAEGRRP